VIPLVEVVQAELERVSPERLVRRAIARGLPMELREGLVLVAFGKAAAAMYEGAFEALGPAVLRAVVVVPEGGALPAARRGLTVHEGAHPLPSASSVAAARAVERLVRTSTRPVLALVSGGASSLLAAPNPGLSLEKKRHIVAQLLASGAPIQDVNLVRRHLSRVKGGGLLRALGPRHMHTLVVSDVVGGRASDVGSGPTVPSPGTLARARAVAERWLGLGDLPLRPCVDRTDPIAARASHAVLISPRAFAVRVARALTRKGLAAHAAGAPTFDLAPLAAFLVARAETLRRGEALVLAAEPTLVLPRGPRGQGGRASHLALVVGPRLPPEVALLSLATDGADGSSGHAGAHVARRTFRGARRAAARALAAFDAGAFVRGLGAHVALRPGHNLTDLLVLVREP